MREPETSCSRCGEVLATAAEIVYSREGEPLCDHCGGPAELGLSWGSAALVARLTQRRALQRRATGRRRRALIMAVAATWILAGAFAAWRVRSLPPRVTIDSPSPGAPVGSLLVVSGRVFSASRHESLWLVTSKSRERGWRPQGELVPAGAGGEGSWQTTIYLEGVRGDRCRLGVVMADAWASASFKEETDAIPEWLRKRDTSQQGGRGRRHGVSGPELPAGAQLLESIDVILAEGSSVIDYRSSLGELPMSGADDDRGGRPARRRR